MDRARARWGDRWWWRAAAWCWGFVSGAHPVFVVLLLLLAPAVVAAVSAKANTPGYALNSLWVYRVQVGLGFFLVEYVLLIAFWLAYQGRSVGKIELPGGAAVDLNDPAQEAADGFEEFRQTTEAQLANDGRSITELTDIVTGMPQPGDGIWRRVRWVLFGYGHPEDRLDPREHRGEPEAPGADE